MPVLLHNREYATVNERLHLAHGDTATDTTSKPRGIQSIATEFFMVGHAILCRATVTFMDGRSFQGTSEVPIDSKQPAERDAPFECAETSAWGRALAAADYPGSDSGIAGAEEVQRPPRARSGEFPEAIAEDTDRVRNSGQSTAPAGGNGATEKQKKAVYAISRGKVDGSTMTRAQASEWIDANGKRD